jgi:hypothetical protein
MLVWHLQNRWRCIANAIIGRRFARVPLWGWAPATRISVASGLHPQQQPLIDEVQSQWADSATIARRFPKKRHPCSLELNLHFVGFDKRFGNQALSSTLSEKHHPRLRMSGYQKQGPFWQGCTKVPMHSYLGYFSISAQPAFLVCVCARGAVQLSGCFFYRLLYIATLGQP